MTPTVAIIAPGNMGAGVGQRLTENKVTVLTSLAGRSAASAARAKAAGMRDADERALMEADFLLSILPPGDAPALAQRLAPLLSAANRKPVYVDCNAVSPATMQATAETIAATGAPFVAAGIIGPPPKPGSANTKLYVSGPAANLVAQLNDHARTRRAAHRCLGVEDVLCRHHQGFHRPRRGHDARRHARRLRRGAQGRA